MSSPIEWHYQSSSNILALASKETTKNVVTPLILLREENKERKPPLHYLATISAMFGLFLSTIYLIISLY